MLVLCDVTLQMGVLQQARYIVSNSGGSWFNGAMSYTQVGDMLHAAATAAAAAAAAAAAVAMQAAPARD
jgi:hypothetical protein